MSPGDSNDPPNDRVDQPAVIQMDSRDTTGSLTDHHWVGWLARSTRAEPPVIQEVLKPNHTRTIRWLRPRSTSRKMNRRTSAYPIVSPLHPSLEFPGLASRSYRIRPSLEVLFDHLALIWKIRLVGGRALRSSPPPRSWRSPPFVWHPLFASLQSEHRPPFVCHPLFPFLRSGGSPLGRTVSNLHF